MLEANGSIFLYQAVQYDKENGHFTTWIDLFKKKVVEIKPEVDDLFKSINDGKEKINEIKQNELFNELFDNYEIKDSRENLEKFFKTVYKGGDVFKEYQKYMKDSGQATTTFTSIAKKAGSVLASFGATIGSMVVNWAIGQAIGWVSEKIDEEFVTNEEYLEQQDEIISKAEETISATESRISALEGLQEKIKATNGVQSEMLKLSGDINTVLGDGKSKILGQAGAYEVLSAQIQQSINLEKKRRNEANKDKREAALNKAGKFTFTNTFGTKQEVTLNDLNLYSYTSRHLKEGYGTGSFTLLDEVNPFAQYTKNHCFSDSIKKYLEFQNKKFKDEILTVEQLVDTYNSAISDYGSSGFFYGKGISISREELKSGFEEQIELLYKGFDDIINNGEGFLINVNKQAIIESMFVANGGIVDQEFIDNVYATINTLDDMGDEVNAAFYNYSAALKDGISGNENEAYNRLVETFNVLKEYAPESVVVLNGYFESIITTLKQGATDSKKEMSKFHNIFDIDFTTNTETIDNFQSKLSSLGDTYSKLLNGNYTGSEYRYPSLGAYSNIVFERLFLLKTTLNLFLLAFCRQT